MLWLTCSGFYPLCELIYFFFFLREGLFVHQTASGVIDSLCADIPSLSPAESSRIRGDVLEVCSCLHFHIVKLILLKSFLSFPC